MDLLKHPWLADLIPRAMAMPLADSSVEGPIVLKVQCNLSSPYTGCCFSSNQKLLQAWLC